MCEKDCDKQLDFYDFSYDFYFFSVLLGGESGIISRFCFGKKPLTSKTGWAVSGSSRGFNSHIALLEEKNRIFWTLPVGGGDGVKSLTKMQYFPYIRCIHIYIYTHIIYIHIMRKAVSIFLLHMVTISFSWGKLDTLS